MTTTNSSTLDLLSPQERQVAALHFVYGDSPADVATLLDLGAHDVAILLTSVAAKTDPELAHAAASRACAERRRSLRDHVLAPGAPRAPDVRDVPAHLAHCAACRAHAERISFFARLIPPDALPWKAVGWDVESILRRARRRRLSLTFRKAAPYDGR